MRSSTVICDIPSIRGCDYPSQYADAAQRAQLLRAEELPQPPLDAHADEGLDPLQAPLEVVDLAAEPHLVGLGDDRRLDGEQRVVDDGRARELRQLGGEIGR